MTYAQARADCAGGCAASSRDFGFPTGGCVPSCGAYRVNQSRAGILQLCFSMPQNDTLYAVIHLCCAAVCDSPVLLDSIPPSMGLLVPRLSPVGPLGLLSHLPAYYLGHRAHPFSYLSLRPSSRRSLHLFLRSPSCSCWTTFNACYHDPRWV